MLPAYAKAHGLDFSVREGWLTGCLERIKNSHILGDNEIELAIAFPAEGDIASSSEVIDGITYYGFVEDLSHPESYDGKVENRFHNILDDFKPDVVHIFGTEFPHSLAMLRCFGNPSRVLLGIQGVCGVIAEEYMAGIPEKVQQSATFRDRIKQDSLIKQQEKYRARAEHEAECIRLTGNITGRTDFDRARTYEINPEARYYHLNETMRPSFYTATRREQDIEEHSIFLSQGDYPLKGFHFVLQAMPGILEKYPDAHLYVAGNNIIGKGQSIYPYFLRAAAYGKYIKSLIRTLHLKKNITMLGMLSEEEMKDRLLTAGVFVCASVVENSPNSLGEAMLLGTPVVASRVGGIPSMVEDGKDGLLFEKADPEDLKRCILQIWDDPMLAAVYGDNARKHARETHSPDRNYDRLLEIYRDINEARA